jgi:hypothetical protein
MFFVFSSVTLGENAVYTFAVEATFLYKHRFPSVSTMENMHCTIVCLMCLSFLIGDTGENAVYTFAVEATFVYQQRFPSVSARENIHRTVALFMRLSFFIGDTGGKRCLYICG